MTIPREEKLSLLTRFPGFLLSEDWSYPQSRDKDRIVLLEFPTIARAYRALSDRYRKVISETAGLMGAGFCEFLDRPIISVSEWDQYCLYAAGLVGVGLTRLFRSGTATPQVAQVADSDMDLSVAMGRFLQKTNIARDYLEDINEGRQFWPQEVWGRYGDTLEELGQPENVAQGVACLNHLITLTLSEAPKVLEYLSGLSEITSDPSLFNFCAIPQVMAIATLLLCYDNRNVFLRSIKIRKGETVSLMQEATSLKGVKDIFMRYSQRIRGRVRPGDPSANETIRACELIEDRCRVAGGTKGTHLLSPLRAGVAMALFLCVLGYKYKLHSIVLSGIQAAARM